MGMEVLNKNILACSAIHETISGEVSHPTLDLLDQTFFLPLSFILSLPPPILQQINNRSLRLGHNRRKDLRDHMGKSCADVLSLLAACLNSCPSNPDLHTRVSMNSDL